MKTSRLLSVIAMVSLPFSVHAFTNASSLYSGAGDPVSVGDVAYTIVELNGGILHEWNAESPSIFTDLPSSHSKFAYLMEAAKEGWIDCGRKSSCNIHPDKPITRGHIASILLKGFHGSVGWAYIGLGQAPSYPDLSTNHEFAEHVRIAADRCILTATTSGNINPDGIVSRSEAIALTNKASQDALLSYNNDCKAKPKDGLLLMIGTDRAYRAVEKGDVFVLEGTSSDDRVQSAQIHGIKPNQISCGDEYISEYSVTWSCTANNTGYEPSVLHFTINKVTYKKSNTLSVKIIPSTKSPPAPSAASSSIAVSRKRTDRIDFTTDISTITNMNPFPDLPSGSLEGKAAAALRTLGVIGGYPDGEFKGDKPVNRAEAAKMLLNASQTAQPYGLTYDMFPDVSEWQWFGRFVMTAAHYNIIKGNPDGYFRPANTINTAEFLKMITRAFNIQEGMSHSYSDVPSDAWFESFAGTAEKYNLFPRRSNKLLPGSTLSRSDVAIAIYQYLLNK